MVEATRQPATKLILPEIIKTPDGTVDRSFGPYAETGEHLEWLKRFLDKGHIKFREGMTILELASGGGHSAKIIWNAIPDDIKSTVRFIVSDFDEDSIEKCKTPFDGIPNIEYVTGDALDIVRGCEESVDAIFYLNGIHLDSMRRQVLEGSRVLLRDDESRILFNSSFTSVEESIPPSEKRFYRKWMVGLRRLMKEEYYQVWAYLNTKPNFEELRIADYDGLIKESGLKAIPIDGFEHNNPNAQLQVSFEGYAKVVQYKYWGDMYHITTDPNIPEEWKNVLWDLLTDINRKKLVDAWLEVLGPDKKVTPRNNMIRLCRKNGILDQAVEVVDNAERVKERELVVV